MKTDKKDNTKATPEKPQNSQDTSSGGHPSDFPKREGANTPPYN